ncbi:hypothetical protein niasHT_027763 [Heterodera trifolii]|uniref:Uncharacterized protein n=1 Tax=Heterodera trifolii TaxID=157864 RepID=A0ABD2KIC8_9BILA
MERREEDGTEGEEGGRMTKMDTKSEDGRMRMNGEDGTDGSSPSHPPPCCHAHHHCYDRGWVENSWWRCCDDGMVQCLPTDLWDGGGAARQSPEQQVIPPSETRPMGEVGFIPVLLLLRMLPCSAKSPPPQSHPIDWARPAAGIKPLGQPTTGRSTTDGRGWGRRSSAGLR